MNKKKKEALDQAAKVLRSGGGKASEPEIVAKLTEAGVCPRVAEVMAREARLKAQAGEIAPGLERAPEKGPVAGWELDKLKAMLPGLSEDEGRLLCAMTILANAHPHPTGRYRYDDDGLAACAGIPSKGDYRTAFAALGDAGLVRCAVVGSANPVPTLSLPWRERPDGVDETFEWFPYARGEGKKLANRLLKEAEGGNP